MSDHIQQTIADLQAKLSEQESAVVKTKRLINQLCEMSGAPPMYQDTEIHESGGLALSIQGDQFYGQPLSTCIRQILEMRKALRQGPATVNEIYADLTRGNYQFETKSEDNAKRGLRISLTKNTAIFHKLPNGKFGLLEWYPNAKSTKQQRDETDQDEEKEETETKE